MLSAVRYFKKYLLLSPLKTCPLVGVHCLNSFFSSTSFTEIQTELQDLEQRALIAFTTMEQIRDLRLNSANNGGTLVTFNKEAVIKKIRSRAAQLEKNKTLYSNWVLKQHNINKVWEGFEDSIGANVNMNIWRQQRFTEILVGERINLIPSYVTGQVFNSLLISYEDAEKKNKIRKNRFVISGEKGAGKSFAYLIYDYLSQFIISFRMRMISSTQDFDPKIFHFVSRQQFDYIKKIIYFPLKQIQIIDKAIEQIAFQGYQGIRNGIMDSQKILIFEKVLQRLRQFYKKYGIEIMAVIDQANYYYSCFRKMLLILSKNKALQLQETQILSVLKNHSAFMRSISRYVDALVFNSSQSVEAKLISDWNLNGKTPTYFDLYDHQKGSIADHYIQYSAKLDTIHGQITLYETFWLQLCHYQLRYNGKNLLKKDSIFRIIFEEIFGISTVKNQSDQQPNKQLFMQWGLDVRHLNIRKICSQKKFINPLLALIAEGQASLPQNKSKIQDQLLKLKISIMSNRYEEVKTKFNAYFNKSVNDQADSARFKMICWINEEAYNKMKEQQDAFQDLETNDIQQQGLDKPDIFTKNDGSGYKVIVDFGQIIKKEIQKQKLLTRKQINAIMVQVNTFTEEVGIGYRDKVNKNKFYFLLDPAILWKITLLLEEDLTKNSSAQLQLLINKIRVSRYTGNYMDIIYYKLFKFTQNFKLIFDKFQQNNSQNKKKYEYSIKKCMDFEWRKSLPKINNKKKINLRKDKSVNLAHQLQDIFNTANHPEYYGEYILGYPTMKNRINQTEIAPNNPLFDFILLRAYDSKIGQKSYAIQAIDIGVGKIVDKLNDKKKLRLKTLIQEILKLPILKAVDAKNIQFKLLVITPQSRYFEFKRQFSSKPLPDLVSKYVLQQTEFVPNGISVTFGIRSVNYFVKNRHLSFPENKKNEQTVFFQTMMKVMSELDKKNQKEK